MSEVLADAEGATPLEPDEREGLIPTYIATRDELNAAEQANIAKGLLRMARRRRTVSALLDELFIRQLHKAMFGDVWRWAGRYRATERNIGVDPFTIAVEVHNLLGDAAYWLADDSRLTLDEAVCKIHHRLVSVHPFPNGNGRHVATAGTPAPTPISSSELRVGRPSRGAQLICKVPGQIGSAT